MARYICTACGTQFAERTDAPTLPPARCPICADERQYIPRSGQRWTTLDEIRTSHANVFKRMEPGLYSVQTSPAFGIDQRAFLVSTSAKTGAAAPFVLWDCVALLDDATVDIIRALGGLAAIAISHPHYYTTMVEWAHAFECPIFLHADDRAWVMRPDAAIHFWEGETIPLDDAGALAMTLVRCGGHFEGGSVLHWASGANAKGALLTGDVLQVGMDRESISVMRSYPNYIPLGEDAVRRVGESVAPFAFERLYGAFRDREVESDAHAKVARSIDRIIAHLGGVMGPDAPPGSARSQAPSR